MCRVLLEKWNFTSDCARPRLLESERPLSADQMAFPVLGMASHPPPVTLTNKWWMNGHQQEL